VSGRYLTVERPGRLSFTWIWDGETEETLVSIDLAAAGDRTGLILTHGGFAEEAARDNHIVGWSDCLERLPGWLGSPGT